MPHRLRSEARSAQLEARGALRAREHAERTRTVQLDHEPVTPVTALDYRVSNFERRGGADGFDGLELLARVEHHRDPAGCALGAIASGLGQPEHDPNAARGGA